MMEKYKILIVEDDSDLREGLSFSFQVMDMMFWRQRPKGRFTGNKERWL